MHASFLPPVIVSLCELVLKFMSIKSIKVLIYFTYKTKDKPKILIKSLKLFFFKLIISLKCEELRNFSYLDQDLN